MKLSMRRGAIVEIIAALLILLFLYTSVSKFVDFKGFVFDMYNQPFPNWIKPILIWSVPILEILISLALMFDKLRIFGFWGSFVIMTMFTIYAATVLANFFGRIPCSCGGVIKYLSWNQHLIFNVFFVSISAIGIWLSNKLPKSTRKIKNVEQIAFH